MHVVVYRALPAGVGEIERDFHFHICGIVHTWFGQVTRLLLLREGLLTRAFPLRPTGPQTPLEPWDKFSGSSAAARFSGLEQLAAGLSRSIPSCLRFARAASG